MAKIDEPTNIEKQNNLDDDNDSSSSSSSDKSSTFVVLSNCEMEKFSNISLLSLMFPSYCEMCILSISIVCTLISQYFFCCSFGILWMILHGTITFGFLFITLIIIYYDEVDILQLIENRLPSLLQYKKSQ
ncbi:unnamed protein product [Schistosoma margrebowiei]|uniref:Transmembrane protein n=1 Tax=Schistosoma margrebowiei TaxID=48269 RepID=A0A3P8D0M8_9TREM|nr:unnamed protein product [Schistosoma margrebowiei]